MIIHDVILFMHVYMIASCSLKCHDMLGIRMHSLLTLAIHVSLKCGVIRFRLSDWKRPRVHVGVHGVARRPPSENALVFSFGFTIFGETTI